MAKTGNKSRTVRSSGNVLTLLLLLPLCLTFLVAARNRAQRKTGQDSTQATIPTAPVYLPAGENDASVMPFFLAYLGEPSLLEAANEVKTFSFRVSFFSPVPTHYVAVRLVVDDDGSGEIVSAVSSGKDRVLKRTENSVTSGDVRRLLQLVSKAEFWSTASVEQVSNVPDKSGRKPYVLDGAWWMLEGVHDGSFHYVFRRNPSPSAITEIGCYLARDLVKPTDAPIPMAGCRSHTPQSR